MKVKCLLVVVFLLGIHWVVNSTFAQVQKPTKTLTLLYSNNINGEIDPCPT
jgi:hypothetical protein